MSDLGRTSYVRPLQQPQSDLSQTPPLLLHHQSNGHSPLTWHAGEVRGSPSRGSASSKTSRRSEASEWTRQEKNLRNRLHHEVLDGERTVAKTVRRRAARSYAPFLHRWKCEIAVASEGLLCFVDPKSGRVRFSIHVATIHDIELQKPTGSSTSSHIRAFLKSVEAADELKLKAAEMQSSDAQAAAVRVRFFSGNQGALQELLFWTPGAAKWQQWLLAAQRVSMSSSGPRSSFVPMEMIESWYQELHAKDSFSKWVDEGKKKAVLRKRLEGAPKSRRHQQAKHENGGAEPLPVVACQKAATCASLLQHLARIRLHAVVCRWRSHAEWMEQRQQAIEWVCGRLLPKACARWVQRQTLIQWKHEAGAAEAVGSGWQQQRLAAGVLLQELLPSSNEPHRLRLDIALRTAMHFSKADAAAEAEATAKGLAGDESLASLSEADEELDFGASLSEALVEVWGSAWQPRAANLGRALRPILLARQSQAFSQWRETVGIDFEAQLPQNEDMLVPIEVPALDLALVLKRCILGRLSSTFRMWSIGVARWAAFSAVDALDSRLSREAEEYTDVFATLSRQHGLRRLTASLRRILQAQLLLAWVALDGLRWPPGACDDS